MRLSAAIVLLGTLLLSGGAAADDRFDRLSRQLQEGKDPRLRAQAALLLAASADKRAVDPLCAALGDGSPIVRVSVAKGLAKLGDKKGRGCLEKRRNDPDSSVREEIEVAVVLLGGAPARPKVYISLGTVKAATSDIAGTVLQLTEAELKQKLVRMGAMMAPEDEDKKSAVSVLKEKRIKGFLITVNVESVSEDGLLMRLLCATYPEKKILGEVTMKGKAKGGSREGLVRAIVPALLDDAAREYGWSP